jgi:UDP-N-acetylbacillosamine N-acetyltransferase
MNNNLLVLGAGGHGRVVKETAEAMGYFNSVDFLDDNSELAIGKCKDFKHYTDEYFYAFVAIGNNEERMRWSEELYDTGFKFPILVHPAAYVSPLANIGGGSIIGENAVVNTYSIVERCCIISIGALVDHDSFVGEYVHIDAGSIVKAGSCVERLKKVDAGMVYSNLMKFEEHSFKVGV